MPLHESKLNLPPRLVISSARIDKTEGISKSKGCDKHQDTVLREGEHQAEGSHS